MEGKKMVAFNKKFKSNRHLKVGPTEKQRGAFARKRANRNARAASIASEVSKKGITPQELKKRQAIEGDRIRTEARSEMESYKRVPVVDRPDPYGLRRHRFW